MFEFYAKYFIFKNKITYKITKGSSIYERLKKNYFRVIQYFVRSTFDSISSIKFTCVLKYIGKDL